MINTNYSHTPAVYYNRQASFTGWIIGTKAKEAAAQKIEERRAKLIESLTTGEKSPLGQGKTVEGHLNDCTEGQAVKFLRKLDDSLRSINIPLQRKTKIAGVVFNAGNKMEDSGKESHSKNCFRYAYLMLHNKVLLNSNVERAIEKADENTF